MSKEIDKLIEFAKKFDSLVCYGASIRAKYLKKVLEFYGINFTCFVISGVVEENETLDGIPVYSIKDFHVDLSSCGIILSLSMRFHKEVIDMLAQLHNCNLCEIFAINNTCYSHIVSFQCNLLRDEVLLQKNVILPNKNYVDKARTILANYESIIIKTIDFRSMGAIGLWPYYVIKHLRYNKNMFEVYYPISSYGNVKSVNTALIKRLKCVDGLDLITENNIDFWRYFISEYKEKITLDYNCISMDLYGDINKVFSDNKLCSRYITFKSSDAEQGDNKLIELGISKNYICISNRDSAYKLHEGGYNPTEIKLGRFRNSDIENYREAISYLSNNNIQAVRMGCLTEKQFIGDNIIDYANISHNEFMDIYISYKCKFFCSDLSGIMAFPILFNKPMVILNAAFLTTKNDAVPMLNENRDIAILKKFWDNDLGRYLTIREMLKAETYENSNEFDIANIVIDYYSNRNITIINNTSTEILEVVREMNECLDGTIVYTEEDILLQEKYNQIITEFSLGNNIINPWRLGKEFIRKNAWLLD